MPAMSASPSYQCFRYHLRLWNGGEIETADMAGGLRFYEILSLQKHQHIYHSVLYCRFETNNTTNTRNIFFMFAPCINSIKALFYYSNLAYIPRDLQHIP